MRTVMTVLAIAALILGTICYKMEQKVKQYHESMYTVEFWDDLGQIVTVRTDRDGIIKSADIDGGIWEEQLIINIKSLHDGDVMDMYDLLTDAMTPMQYKVVKIAKK